MAAAFGGAVAVVARVLAYIALLLGTSSTAYKLQDWGPKWRWFCGFLCAVVLSVFKTLVLVPAVLPGAAPGGASGPGGYGTILGDRMVLYALTALWECSNASLVFGGNELLQKLGITSNKRALVAGLAPCQIKFVTSCTTNNNTINNEKSIINNVEQKPQQQQHTLAVMHVQRTNRRSLHIILCFVVGYCSRLILLRWCSAGPSKQSIVRVVLETEVLAILLSVFVVAVFDAPSHLWQLAANPVWRYFSSSSSSAEQMTDATRIEATLPYGAVYLSTSTRDFWRKWSRPATQLIRQIVYHPLDGPRRPYLAIPLIFVGNGASYYEVGKALVGDRQDNKFWTIIVFGVLGLAATFEVLATNFMTTRVGAEEARREALISSERTSPKQEDDVHLLPLWFRLARGVAAHLSIRVALYVFVHRCLNVDLWSLLGGSG